MSSVNTTVNPDLEIIGGNQAHWTHADHRRRGWHNLHRIARYGISFRAAQIMTLERRMDLSIADLESVRHFTSLPWFSAMVVIRDQHVLYERYATDFGPDQPHSIQSITKTTINLIVGQLVDQGILDLTRRVSHYIPEMGSGYGDATLQQVLNMDVANDYSEDFTDPSATYYTHEEAMGWRLPREPGKEQTEHSFVRGITSKATANHSGQVQYKDANTAVLGWVVERASTRPLRAFLADIVDSAGMEGAFYITTDREGTPTLEGGGCLTARDLARYFAIFSRFGRAISGEMVGSKSFIATSLSSGVPMVAPYDGMRYSNHLMVLGRSVGHAGWGGQFVLANLETGTIAVYFSVIENQHATNREFIHPVIRMLESIVAPPPESPL